MIKKLLIIIAVLATFSVVSCQKSETDNIKDNDKTEQPSNCIYYTTSDGKKLTPSQTDASCFGASLVSNTYADGQGVLVFDDAVTSIGEEAFRSCSTLASISIPSSVTLIGDKAFRFCSSLASITIPNGVTSIGEEALSMCSILKTVEIPNSVTSIGDQAFRNCPKLRNITIPNSVTSIGNRTFFHCI